MVVAELSKIPIIRDNIAHQADDDPMKSLLTITNRYYFLWRMYHMCLMVQIFSETLKSELMKLEIIKLNVPLNS